MSVSNWPRLTSGFGSRVTVIEREPQLMSREDSDVADEMQRILSNEGVEFLTAAELLNVRGRSGEHVSVMARTARTPAGGQEIEGSDILVATGRVPNTAGIGLDEAGIELDARGYIRVNERLEKPLHPMSGRSENAPAAHNSRMSLSTIFASSKTISSAEATARATAWCHTACSPILHLLMWA
jgi:alkyl hydroperoxide reductase subunit AhpF